MKEKRRFIRFNVDLKACYMAQKGPKEEKQGVTRNISVGGIELLCGEKLNPGDTLEIKIFIPEAPNPVHLTGSVLRCEERKNARDKAFSAGIEFMSIEEDNKNTLLEFLCGLMDKK